MGGEGSILHPLNEPQAQFLRVEAPGASGRTAAYRGYPSRCASSVICRIFPSISGVT